MINLGQPKFRAQTTTHNGDRRSKAKRRRGILMAATILAVTSGCSTFWSPYRDPGQDQDEQRERDQEAARKERERQYKIQRQAMLTQSDLRLCNGDACCAKQAELQRAAEDVENERQDVQNDRACGQTAYSLCPADARQKDEAVLAGSETQKQRLTRELEQCRQQAAEAQAEKAAARAQQEKERNAAQAAALAKDIAENAAAEKARAAENAAAEKARAAKEARLRRRTLAQLRKDCLPRPASSERPAWDGGDPDACAFIYNSYCDDGKCTITLMLDVTGGWCALGSREGCELYSHYMDQVPEAKVDFQNGHLIARPLNERERTQKVVEETLQGSTVTIKR